MNSDCENSVTQRDQEMPSPAMEKPKWFSLSDFDRSIIVYSTRTKEKSGGMKNAKTKK